MPDHSANDGRWVLGLGRIALLAAAYWTVAKLGLLAAIPPGYATAIWPASGMAVAALVAFGNASWPGIWIGAFLVNLGVQSSFAAAAIMGTGNTLEGVLAAWLVRQTLGNDASFERGADVGTFLGIAALSAVVAATFAAVPLHLVHEVSLSQLAWNVLTWWQGDAMGIVLVTPLILSWCAPGQVEWSAKKVAEAAALAAATLAAGWIVFAEPAASRVPTLALSFLVLPPVIWAALRFRQREVCTVVALVCAVAVACTVQGLGPFWVDSLNASLLVLLAFLSTVAATGFVLCAVVGERGHKLAALSDALREMRRHAVTDPLTRLYNRRFLHAYLARELRRAARRDHPVALLMLDLDHFKRVNDTLGHATGDQVLRRVASHLGHLIRSSDVACRYGGEEFVVVLPDSPLGSAGSKAESIRQALERDAKGLHGVTASIGVAIFPEHARALGDLIRVADRALYEAKASGRNRVVIGHERTVRLAGPAALLVGGVLRPNPPPPTGKPQDRMV
jgi:diguanylate cyclase (GGDEF)-like protein